MPALAPRLYLITPRLARGTCRLPLSASLMAACGVDCLLVRMAAPEDRVNEGIFCTLAEPVQKEGIACLVEGEPELCIRAKADGVHLSGEEPRLEAALRLLKPGFIVGAGDLRSRHAAMTAGEAGVDYVMFGDTGEPQSAAVERVAWWAEIFTVPCVGYVNDLSSLESFVRAGADFIALCGAVFCDPRGAEAALREAAGLILASAPAAAG